MKMPVSDTTNVHIQLPHSVTMDVMEKLFSQIRELKLNASEFFILDASQVANITTPGVQLIVSLDRSLKEQNVKLSIVNPTEGFSSTFQTLGLGAALTGWSAV